MSDEDCVMSTKIEKFEDLMYEECAFCKYSVRTGNGCKECRVFPEICRNKFSSTLFGNVCREVEKLRGAINEMIEALKQRYYDAIDSFLDKMKREIQIIVKPFME